MRNTYRIVLSIVRAAFPVAGLAVAIPFAPTAAAAPMPPGAYLPRPAATAEVLGRQVRSRAAIRARYERTWRMSGPAVLKRVASLKRGRLSASRVLAVYYYRPAEGAWGYKVRRVPAATPAFLGPDGTPHLLQVCGNPVRALSPARVSRLRSVKAFDPRESEVGFVEEGRIDATPVLTGGMLAAPILETFPVVAQGGEAEPLAVRGSDADADKAAGAVPPVGRSGLNATLLAPLAALAGAAPLLRDPANGPSPSALVPPSPPPEEPTTPPAEGGDCDEDAEGEAGTDVGGDGGDGEDACDGERGGGGGGSTPGPTPPPGLHPGFNEVAGPPISEPSSLPLAVSASLFAAGRRARRGRAALRPTG